MQMAKIRASLLSEGSGREAEILDETGSTTTTAASKGKGKGDLSGKGEYEEKPVHEVKIGYSFAVGKYEVTQVEWYAVIGGPEP